jgi:peroxiredoxin
VELQNQLPAIKAQGGEVLAVSTDELPTSRSMASQLRLGYPILEDRDHALGSAFGVFRLPGGMDMGPVDSHSIFVVDTSGKVAWRQLAPDTMHVPVDQVVDAVAKAR